MIIQTISNIIGGIIAFALTCLIAGFFVALIWNAVVPAVFSLPQVTYIQASLLYALSSFLIKPMNFRILQSEYDGDQD